MPLSSVDPSGVKFRMLSPLVTHGGPVTTRVSATPNGGVVFNIENMSDPVGSVQAPILGSSGKGVHIRL